jgi:hypothetical protein
VVLRAHAHAHDLSMDLLYHFLGLSLPCVQTAGGLE